MESKNARMICHLCSPDFQIYGPTLIHSRRDHLENYQPFSCPQCQKRFSTEEIFKRHAMRKHREKLNLESLTATSDFLEIMDKVMLQYNIYTSKASAKLSEEMVIFMKEMLYELPGNDKERKLEGGEGDAQGSIIQKRQRKIKKTRGRPNALSAAFHRTRSTSLCNTRSLATRNDRKQGSPQEFHCSGCERQFSGSVAQHLAIHHIRKPVVSCNKCDYTDVWNPTNVRKHINGVHKGRAEVVDERHTIFTKINSLQKRFIARNNGKPLRLHKFRSEPGTRSSQKRAKQNDLQKKATKGTCSNKKVYCKKCKIYMLPSSVANHLASSQHIGKFCLRCNKCSFKVRWNRGDLLKHNRMKHNGKGDYIDTRDEIRDEIQKLRNRYIVT